MKHLLLVAVLAICIGCHGGSNPVTVAPRNVVASQASFSGNVQNSGIYSSDATGFLVDLHFLDRHGLKTTDEGVTAEGSKFRLTAEVMDRCITLDQRRRNAQK